MDEVIFIIHCVSLSEFISIVLAITSQNPTIKISAVFTLQGFIDKLHRSEIPKYELLDFHKSKLNLSYL